MLGTNTQVCWHKFLRYWDVEERPVSLEGSQCVTDPERAAAACDENTIGVVSRAGQHVYRRLRECQRAERGARPVAGKERAWIFPSTSMARAARSWRPSCSLSCCGIFNCRA